MGHPSSNSATTSSSLARSASARGRHTGRPPRRHVRPALKANLRAAGGRAGVPSPDVDVLPGPVGAVAADGPRVAHCRARPAGHGTPRCRTTQYHPRTPSPRRSPRCTVARALPTDSSSRVLQWCTRDTTTPGQARRSWPETTRQPASSSSTPLARDARAVLTAVVGPQVVPLVPGSSHHLSSDPALTSGRDDWRTPCVAALIGVRLVREAGSSR